MPDQVPFSAFWSILGKLVSFMVTRKAHAEIILIIRDGAIQRVNVHQSYLPANIPDISKV